MGAELPCYSLAGETREGICEPRVKFPPAPILMFFAWRPLLLSLGDPIKEGIRE